MVGDELEVRGPIGGWFVWRGDTPAVLIGGGSGVVPLMAMLRLARRNGRGDLLKLVVSVRRPGELYYAAELPGPQSTIIYTRSTPPSWPRPAGRLSPADLPGTAEPGGYRVRVRLVRLRRRRDGRASGAGDAGRAHPGRAVRPHRLTPPARPAEPGRLGRAGGAGPGRWGRAGPGRWGRAGKVGPGRAGKVGPGRGGGAGPGREGGAGPGREGGAGPGRWGRAGKAARRAVTGRAGPGTRLPCPGCAAPRPG